MISAAHVIVYSKDADADRAFFRDILGLPSVDAGHGWLIFALPPSEVAFHPNAPAAGSNALSNAPAAGGNALPSAPEAGSNAPADDARSHHELYLMCTDLAAEILTLQARGVHCSKVHQERWGSITRIRLPGGSELGLYQPTHPTAFGLTPR